MERVADLRGKERERQRGRQAEKERQMFVGQTGRERQTNRNRERERERKKERGKRETGKHSDRKGRLWRKRERERESKREKRKDRGKEWMLSSVWLQCSKFQAICLPQRHNHSMRLFVACLSHQRPYIGLILKTETESRNAEQIMILIVINDIIHTCTSSPNLEPHWIRLMLHTTQWSNTCKFSSGQFSALNPPPLASVAGGNSVEGPQGPMTQTFGQNLAFQSLKCPKLRCFAKKDFVFAPPKLFYCQSGGG